MSESLGTVYVEIDLDKTKFEKRQQQLLSDIKKITNEVEGSLQKSFQNLGVKTDNIYQLMANNAIVSYERIKNAANTTAAEEFRSRSAMVAKINSLNMEMTKNPLYETLGVRSVAAIEAQKAAVISSYDTIKKSGTATAQDLVNIERAKNDKLKALNKEMVGDHDMSITAMTRAVLRLYAAYYVASVSISAMIAPLKKGFDAVEQLNTGIAETSAMVMSFSERQAGMSFEDQWKNALKYSTALVPVLEQIAAKTLLSGQETIALSNAFARNKVFLDAENAAQVEGFTRISNAMPLMTKGQEIMRQINTEITALMTGTAQPSAMLLKNLKAIDPAIESHLKTWQNQNTVLEHMGELLKGFGPATNIIEKQWTAVKTEIDTTATQILRGVMQPAYESIIESTKELNGWLVKNKEDIADWGVTMHMNAIRIAQAFLLIATQIDKIGGTMTQMQMLLYGPGMMMGAESSTKRFDAALARNEEYAKRFKESDDRAAELEVTYNKLAFSLTEEGKAQAKAAAEAGGAAQKIKGLAGANEEAEKASEKAAKAAEKHAEKIKDVIANLQWETQMLSLSEDEQYRMNQLKAAGIDINDKMAASVLAVADAYLVAKKNAESWKPFLDFMSDEKTNDMSIQLHEGAMEAQEKNLQSMVGYWPEIADASSDSAKRTDEAWTEAAKNIQNAWAGLFSKIFRGEITGADDVLKELMYTMSDSAAQNLAAQLRDIDWNKALGGMDNDLGEFFTNILDDFGMTAGQAVNGLAAVIATAYSAVGMAKKDAALSGSMTGASVGGQAGGGYGAAIGAVLGGAGGWLLGTNGPSYGERLSDAIEKLIETLQENNVMLADQILKTDELTLAQDKMQRSIFSTKMEGVNATLAGAFKIPEGMEKRDQSGWESFGDVYKSFAVDLVSGMTESYQRTLDLTLHGETNYGVKDKGYTSTDYSKADTSKIISGLIFGDEFFKGIGVPDFITLMKQTSNDAGALIDKLVEVGYITAEIPERVLEYYSGGSSKAKRIEKVADAIFEVMLNGIMELSAGIDEMNLASEAFAKTWADKSLTSKAKDMQDWQDTMNVFSGEGMKGYLAQIEATRDALLSISDEDLTKLDTAALEDHFKKISALDKVLTDSVGKIEEAEQTRIVIEQYYADARSDILSGMTEEMDIASGKYSQMEQTYMSIMDAAEKYRLELVDQGMEYQEAGAASKEYAIILKGVALATQLAADTANYESRILQEKISRATTLNKTEELQALNQELINNNRKAEVQALMDTYKAGTPAYQAMIKLAKETWGVEDAANNATGAMAKVAEAMEGMWTKDSEAVAKGWWLQINEALGRAFTPTLFLDSLGLGKDSGLEGLLSANSMEEVDSDLRELITLWRTGAIKEDQANSILSKINENAATIGQKIDDLANSLSQQREIGKASQEWYDSFFADSGPSELDKSLKDAGDTLEDFRQQIRDAGGSVRAGWEAGGTIETAVKDAIRSNFLADFRSEFADAASQSSYMQSKSDIGKQAGDWEQTYLGATVDPEIIAARIAAINTELEANLTILNQQAIARADESGVLAGINESIPILTDNAQNSITTLNGLARSEEELNAIRQYAADQTRQLNMDLLNNVLGTAFDITGDTDILAQQLIDLATDWQKADAQDYGEQYDILTKQNDILTQLRDIQKQQLEETIGNYNALQDVILDLQGGSMAPVQSKEFFDKRYAQLYEAAQSGKSSDINNLTGFISQYADFMGAYGDTNYKEFTASIISDFEALQGSITGGATLDDLNAQLATLNSASSPIVSELIRIGDILAGLTGSGSLSQAMAFDEQAYLKRYADVAAAVIAGQFASGLEHYQKFGQSENRLPGFARGGSFIAGENGAEIVNIGSGSSARIFNSGETAKIIADAVSKAIGGAVGGGNVTVHVSIDGKAIAPSMVKVIQTNPEAQYQIKRVANGR